MNQKATAEIGRAAEIGYDAAIAHELASHKAAGLLLPRRRPSRWPSRWLAFALLTGDPVVQEPIGVARRYGGVARAG